MQRICCLALLWLLALAIGCGQKGPRKIAEVDGDRRDKDLVRVGDNGKRPDPGEKKNPEVVDDFDVRPAEGDAREAALLEAIDHLSEKKYDDALVALRKAQAARKDYSEAIEQEIFKVRSAKEREEAAKTAVDDVKTVLNEGKADAAADLAGKALEQFGGGDQAPELARLKQEADAVVTAAAPDADGRFASLRDEATGHVERRNLRAAAAALEQALAVKQDEVLAEQLAKVRVSVTAYDGNRARAAALRRDPTRLPEAIDALKAAQQSWDTLEVRQQIDEYALVLERRRDRVAVAHFDVRGNLAALADGLTGSEVAAEVAEKLLPHFKPRFDVVERGQFGRVLEELRIESGDLAENAAARRELAAASRVRYLVVGSVSSLGGLTVSARLVETATGLVVQTGSVSAFDLPSVLPKLKQLALILQLNDEQKLEFEARLVKNVVAVRPVEAAPVVNIDPIPELPPQPLPRAEVIITHTPAPLPLGNVTIQHFNDLPPVLVAPQPVVVNTLVIEGDRRNRLLRLSLELGDNLFRRRRFQEAERHYALALNLGGPRREIAVRVDTCRRYLPPPPPPVVVVPRPLVVVPQPVYVEPARPVVVVNRVRPRLAMFGFVHGGDPGLVPAAMGDWAADSIAPYLGSRFELIDRGEVSWYMGRLNVTMRDLLADQSARIALARALNARFFVFGTILPTRSFDVSTHLMDVESGARTGTGAIHVKDQSEMKLRLSELVAQMGVAPGEQKQLVKQGQDNEKALNATRAALNANDPGKAADIARAALKASPDNVALASALSEAERKQSQAKFDAERRAAAAAQEKAINEARKRQLALAAAATAAREKAGRDAAARDDAARKQQQQQKETAALNLRNQAKGVMKSDPARAVSLLQSAVALKASDDTYRELGEAKAAADKARQDSAAAEKKKRDDAFVAQRKAAQDRIDAERAAVKKADDERRKAEEARDQTAYDALMKQGKALFEAKKYAEAQAAAQSARKMRDTPESLDLVRRSRDAIALAATTDAAERKRIQDEQKKLADADVARKKKQDDYLGALNEGKRLIDAKKYDDAAKQYAAAKALFDTDAAKAGLKASEQLGKQERDAAAAAVAAKKAESEKDQRLKAILTQAKAALDGRDYKTAIAKYREAGNVAPGNVDALAGLSRAEREKSDDDDYRLAMSAGESAVKAKNYQGAANAYRQALAKRPGDQAATAALTAAQKLVTPTPDPKEARYAASMKAAKAAFDAKQFADAARQYEAALADKPNDPAATNGRRLALAEVNRPDPKVEETKKREAAYKAAFDAGRSAEAAKKWAEAAKLYGDALAQKPSDPAALAARKNALTEADKLDNAGKREAAYQAAMKQAKALFDGKKYADALKTYDAALAQKPGDAAAIAGRRAAQAEIDRPDPKVEEAKKREAAYRSAMKQASNFVETKKYADAVKMYDAALAQKPGDAAAIAGRRAAQAEIDRPDPKVEEAKKREAAYQTAMKQAKALFDGKKYADALKAYDAALAQKPGDAAAVAGRRAAQAEIDRPDPKVEEAKKREAAYQSSMKTGKAAMDAKRFAEALKAYDDALRLKAGDAAAIAGKRAAQTEIDRPDPKVEEAKKREAAYQTAMKQAKALFDGKKYAEAARTYDAALAQKPGDAAAIAGKRAAQVEIDRPDPKAEEAKKREAAYQTAMNAGKAAMAAKRFAEAAKAYDDALRIKPGDGEAIKGKRAATDAQPAPPPKTDARAEFAKAIASGDRLERDKKHADAVNAYTSAVKWATDANDRPGQARAYLGVGRNEHAQRRYPEAIRAYDEVLKREANNAEAKAALTRAKANKQ